MKPRRRQAGQCGLWSVVRPPVSIRHREIGHRYLVSDARHAGDASEEETGSINENVARALRWNLEARDQAAGRLGPQTAIAHSGCRGRESNPHEPKPAGF
jgi:hypothetical protein